MTARGVVDKGRLYFPLGLLTSGGYVLLLAFGRRVSPHLMFPGVRNLEVGCPLS